MGQSPAKVWRKDYLHPKLMDKLPQIKSLKDNNKRNNGILICLAYAQFLMHLIIVKWIGGYDIVAA